MEEREAGLTLIDCLERWRDEYGAAVAVRDKRHRSPMPSCLTNRVGLLLA